MRKKAGNGDIAVIDRFAADRLQAREQLNLPVGLGVVFIAGEQ